MVRIGCHVWCGPDRPDIEAAHQAYPQASEVWVSADHPRVTAAALWSGATIHTAGPGPAPLTGPFVIHHDTDASLELLTLDRPRHTVVIPRPYPSASSPDAPS